MKATLLALTLMAFSSSMALASPETTVDLAKFEKEAVAKIESAFGLNSVIGTSRILFQDGAGAMDLPKFSDFAALNYVTSLKPGTLPKGTSLVSYRLSLAGGVAQVMIVDQLPTHKLAYMASDSGVAVLKPGSSTESVLALEKKLNAVAPEATLEFLEQIGVVSFECSPKNIAKIMAALGKSSIVTNVDLNPEMYPIPFQFIAPIQLKNSGKKDLDGLRTLTKELFESGKKAVVKAVVPARLR
jgi:hypothetical protein